MTSLLTIRDSIRDFIKKYDNIAMPIFRFMGAFILFMSLRFAYGYSGIANNLVVILALAVICAFVSDSVMLLFSGVYTALQVSGLSLEAAIVYVVLFALMYFVYIKYSPKSGYVFMFTPVFYVCKLPYLVPILVGIFLGPIGIIPTAFGVILYYFSQYVDELGGLLATASEEDGVQAFTYLIDSLLNDKMLMLTIVVFGVVIIVTYAIYRMSVEYAWYIAIVAGGIVSIILFFIGGFALELDVNVISVLFGSIIAILLGGAVQFFKGVVDYSRTEVVQFEDDDYYYYVKAVPKLSVSAKNVNVKKINTRKHK